MKYLQKRDRQGLLNLLPGELKRYADVEMTRTGVDVNSGRDLSKYIYGEDWNNNFSQFDKNMNYQFATFFEYLLAEILELSGNITRDDRKKNLTFDHIQRAIKNDEELNKVFKDI